MINYLFFYLDKYQQILYENVAAYRVCDGCLFDKYQQILYENGNTKVVSLSPLPDKYQQILYENLIMIKPLIGISFDKYQQILYENSKSFDHKKMSHTDKYQQIPYENALETDQIFARRTININRYCTKTHYMPFHHLLSLR